VQIHLAGAHFEALRSPVARGVSGEWDMTKESARRTC